MGFLSHKVIADIDAANKSMQFLNSNDFYDKKHQLIYGGLVELYNKNSNIDYVAIIEKLKKSKTLEDAGGTYYITGLTNSAPSSQNIEYYANIVKEKSTLRNIIKIAKDISEEAYDNKEELVESLIALVNDGDKVLVKGSRGMQMETIVETLLED